MRLTTRDGCTAEPHICANRSKQRRLGCPILSPRAHRRSAGKVHVGCCGARAYKQPVRNRGALLPPPWTRRNVSLPWFDLHERTFRTVQHLGHEMWCGNSPRTHSGLAGSDQGAAFLLLTRRHSCGSPCRTPADAQSRAPGVRRRRALQGCHFLLAREREPAAPLFNGISDFWCDRIHG